MNLSFLDQQIQNDIIMMQRPSLPYIHEIKDLSDWYDGESAFHEENKIRWIFDAIRLRREILMDFLEIQFEKYLTIDIAGNLL
jgi:hypothetical protein